MEGQMLMNRRLWEEERGENERLERHLDRGKTGRR